MNKANQKAPHHPSSSDIEQHKSESTNFDWSSVFPPGRIKAQIQQEDDNVGCLPKKTLELISTCSTLLLREIVQTSCALMENENIKMESGRQATTAAALPPGTMLLSAKDIQNGIRKGPECLQFLQNVVDQAVRDDDGKVASRKIRKRKATNSAAASRPLSKLLKDTNTTAGISKETLEEAVELSKVALTPRSKDTVVLDEEDYD